MTNAIILRRIAALYAAGEIDDAKLAVYVEKGIITQEEADEIKGGTAK